MINEWIVKVTTAQLLCDQLRIFSEGEELSFFGSEEVAKAAAWLKAKQPLLIVEERKERKN